MLQQPLRKVISCSVAVAQHVHRCAAYLLVTFDKGAQISTPPSLLNLPWVCANLSYQAVELA